MFIGRDKELTQLEGLLRKDIASLIVVKGRRRIGKSRLLQEFAKRFTHFYEFSGLAPEKNVTATDQRETFAQQIASQLGIPRPRSEDWADLFATLAHHTRKGQILILLDEISWIGADDSTFLGKLKIAWDTQFKKNSRVVLALCGSVSSWIDDNILSSTGFVGRLSLNLTLGELPLSAANLFWGSKRQQISAHEKFKLLSVTGGVPRYLEEIRPDLDAETNIRQLCFQKEGILVVEFEQIFSTLFAKYADLYKGIVRILADGSRTTDDIYAALGKEKGGTLLKHLMDLQSAGFISRDYTWHLKNGRVSKLSTFRLSDNYVRFYLKYIEPNRHRIESDHFRERSLSTLPGWESIMGFQFENLVLNNREEIRAKIGILREDIICDNPFFQRKTLQTPGCQIDYLMHTRFNTLYLCEIKYTRQQIGLSVIDEIKEKIARLQRPKHFSVRPILIYEGELDESVVDAQFFDRIIAFADLLE